MRWQNEIEEETQEVQHIMDSLIMRVVESLMPQEMKGFEVLKEEKEVPDVVKSHLGVGAMVGLEESKNRKHQYKVHDEE